MNQDKGIGAYKDRPGYFMGGMIGGAILGALVNKIQGKDWKRGALMGGIGGGLGSWAGSKLAPAAGSKLNWMQKLLYAPGGPAMSKYQLHPALGAFKGLGLGAAAGAGASYLMGDPDADRRKQEEYMSWLDEKRRKKNLEQYAGWYDNPWEGWNKGGAISARPGYQHGGSATLEYTDPDLYTPTGESGGPSSNPILQLPLGPEGSFLDEFEELDLASNPSAGDEAFQAYENYIRNNNLTEEQLPFETFIEMWREALAQGGGQQGPAMAAEGGYKTRPQYQGGGMTNDEAKAYQGLLDSGYTEDEAIKIIKLHGSDYGGLQVPDFLKSQALGDAQGGYKTRPQYEGGGTGDMDLTQGGASFGVGTGTSDDIPAMLSDGEFVVTANAVKNLGGGDRMVGAKRMYQMMNSLDPNSQTPAEMDTTGIA